MNCPNKSSKEWKAIVNKYSEDVAWAAYIKNNEEIPQLSYVDSLMSKEYNIKKYSEEELRKQEQILTSIRGAIVTQLSKMGAGIGSLTEYEEKNGIEGNMINGVFDPQAIQKTAEGLINLIRIAQGNRGNMALPEEFSHLVDAVLKGTGNPVYDRLTNMLRNEDIVREVFEQDEAGSYDKYYTVYNGNNELMADEARAKLIAKHIIRNEEIKQSPWQSLMQRLKDLYYKYFSKGDANDLQFQLYEADKEFGKFAADLMSGQVNINIDLNSLQNKHIMYNAKSTLSKSEQALKKIIEQEHKRLKIWESNKRLTDEQELHKKKKDIYLDRLEVMKNQKRFDEAIIDFTNQAYQDMDSLIQQADSLKLYNNIPTSDINSTAKFLRELKNYINAYSPIVQELVSYTNTEEYKQQGMIDLNESLKNFNHILNKAQVQYNEAALPLFKQFIKQFTGNLKINDNELESLITEAKSDIGFMDRWLFSMAESNDLMLRLIERPVKNARFVAKQQSDETVRQLQKAQEDLEKAGYKTDFIYEKNEHGHLTGRYIQELDWNKFYQAQNEEYAKLNKKYGNRNQSNLWWKDFYEWQSRNMTQNSTTNKWEPKASIYTNPAYTSLSTAQKAFYNKIISIKKEADSMLPENKMNPYLLPQIRKDFLERIKESKGFKDVRSKLASGFADKWIYRESDDEFGTKQSLQDFDGTQLNLLPVYYIAKLDDMEQLSTDIVSSLAMYADMAYNYNAMNKIIDIMEVGKDIMANRNIDETVGGKSMIEIIQRKGRTISNKIIKRKGSSRFIDRLQDYYESQIYGKTQTDQGTFKILFTDAPISIAKAANNINQLTALNTYALNLLSGVSNVTMGKVMMRIEAISKEYLDMKDLLWADKTYASQLPSVIGQIGQRRKTDKLDLMMIKFNVLQDHDRVIRELEMNKKNIFTRLCNTSSLFFLNNCGEHYMQTRTFLSLANKIKLKDSRGQEINLWDAYEVKKGKDGIERLEIKSGLTKLDGTEFTDKDVEAISRKSARINQKLHGIYNKEDMNAFQRTAQGRLAMMFRKWMVPAYNRRFQSKNYSFDLDSADEGYYRSAYYSFFKVLGKDLMDMKVQWGMRFNELNPQQKANVLRSITEAGHLIALIIASSLLSNMWDGDDEWYKSFALYQLRRLQTEIGVLTPGPQILQEGLTLLKSPAAGINYIQNLVNLMYVTDWLQDPVESGQYKGWNRGARNVVKVLPFNNTIRRAMSPEEALKFYILSK